MSEENEELQAILGGPSDQAAEDYRSRPDRAVTLTKADSSAPAVPGLLRQWATQDGQKFQACGATRRVLPPGVYEILATERGIVFLGVPVKTEGLVRFPHTNSETILQEIQTFWEQEGLYREYDLAHKRGILLWGPPGSGKTSLIQLLMRDVIERGGVVFKFTYPSAFAEGLRQFRQVQPKTPVVVMLEDIDGILRDFSESETLNILDGVDRVNRIVFLATTNYPELLGARIVNRPSRFDKRFKIGHPTFESRLLYLEHLVGGRNEPRCQVTPWARDTEGFSLAHLKELFTAVVILGDEYADALKTLSGMRATLSSTGDGAVGFRH